MTYMSEATQSNPFGDGFKESVAGQFVKWEKVGDTVKGILVDIEDRPSPLTGNIQKIYTLQLEDGTEIRVGGRPSIDSGMRGAVRGQWIGMLYADDIKSKKAGNNAFKLIKVYKGELDPSYKANEDSKSAIDAVFSGKVEDIKM